MQISGSSAIVVGGAGGLGEATVRRLHAAGAKVVIADLADEKGKALADELDARYVRTDATNTEDVNAALAEAESLGPLRISVEAHDGPASGGRLIGKDGSPLDLDGFKTTIDVYLTESHLPQHYPKCATPELPASERQFGRAFRCEPALMLL